MMRYKESILLLLLATLLTTSCTQNELPSGSQETTPLTFKLCLSGSRESLTRAVAPPFYENLNMPVYLYLYKGDEEIPFAFMSGEIDDGEEATFTYWPENDTMREDRYNIYAVGYKGAPSDIRLDENTRKSDLLNLVQANTEINDDGKMYMLSGGLSNVDLIEADKTIALKRNVCRFSFEIADNTLNQVLTKIKISLESFDKTYVFDSDIRGAGIPGGAINTVEYSKEVTPVNHVFNDSIYFFEKKPTVDGMQEGDSVLVTVKAYRPAPAEDLTYQFYLNKDEGYITRRNTIYKVKAGLSLTEITLSWNDEINWDGQVEDGVQSVTPD